jgi:uncharacterized protein YidB (DUF937 family)
MNTCSGGDALESALAMYVAAKEPLPTSSEVEVDEVMVALSALGMMQGLGRAELAPRLRWHLPQVVDKEPSELPVGH